MKTDKLLLGLCIGFMVGLVGAILLLRAIYADSIDRWNEVTYKYSYCPYCGEELEIGFDDK